MDKIYDKYTVNDFMKDKGFLLWRLSPSKETDTFWNNFLSQHPEQRETLERAIQILRSAKTKEDNLSDNEVQEIFKRTLEYRKSRQKKTIRLRIYYYAAACIAILVLFSLSIYLIESPFSDSQTENKLTELKTESSDIQLILGEKEKMTFNEDADIVLNKTGEVHVIGKTTKEAVVSTTDKKVILNKLYVPNGKRSSLTLPDSTKVWINSGTTITFPSTFKKDERAITVNGEIYIEVTKDEEHPFHVKTTNFDVKVLGTHFNVMAYDTDEEKSVVLAEGCVEVTDKSNRSQLMKPDEMLKMNNDGWKTSIVDTYNYICWKDGILQFSNESLANILLRLSRYYGIKFECNENADRLICTGKLVLFDDIHQVITTLKDIFPIQYTMEENKIKIDVKP